MKRNLYSTVILTLSFLVSVTLFGQGVNQLWGITTSGGTEDIGAIFKANGDGTNAQGMFSFTRTNPGASPMYNQLAEYNGKFYSMTRLGGVNNLGVIFEWDPTTNAYTKKYDFDGITGSNPFGSLVLVSDKFYGMTNTGGANNLGVIFEWDPATNAYTKKYDFDGINGGGSYGSLTEQNSKLYGMTNTGGANNLGVIFEWDLSTNTYTKKYDFDGTNGGNPYGHLAIYSGKFYGMTSLGGVLNDGVIFEWDPATNSYTKKADFGTFSDELRYGSKPFGSLVFEGSKFYGMTSVGGRNARGTIFEWDPLANVLTKRFDFGGGTNIENPFGNLLYENGKFYGMASIRGTSRFTEGGLFEWDPVTNGYSLKYQYSRNSTAHLSFTGASPFGSLVAKAGKVYGMTSAGGDDNKGVIFEYDPVANTYAKKINFIASLNGKLPESGLSYNGNNIYGLTKRGGSEGLGAIFEWDLGAAEFNKKHDFNPTNANGRFPVGTMTLLNGKYYGVGFFDDVAPAYISMVLYEWDPVTNIYTVKSTATAIGMATVGKLVESGGKLYGMYSGRDGGTNGGIFRYDTATNAVVRIFSFDTGNPLNGVRPLGGLVESGGKLYGVTSRGGVNNAGVLFEWDIAAGTFTKKHDFNAATGSAPAGTLVLDSGILYGTTQTGGDFTRGVLFEWDIAAGTYTKKYDFNTVTGRHPNGFLVMHNGKLYGATMSGGDYDLGVIYEWDPVSDTYTKKSDFTGANGRTPDPKNNFVFVPAPVARGIFNNCLNLSSVTIDASNSNSWVPLLDNDGNVVGEINANGNNLGIVNTSLYINNSSVREDHKGRLYADRNILIAPQHQPDSAVDIRLYIRATELETLKSAVNSNGDSSGVNTIDDLGIFWNNDDCGSLEVQKGKPVTTTASTWGPDYVLSASVDRLSMYYFSGKSGVENERPIVELSGELQNNNVLLTWKTENLLNAKEFIVERSIDGNVFKAIGTVAAANDNAIQQYNFTNGINTAMDKPVYYRLKQNNADGNAVYSKTILFLLSKNNSSAMLYPNPVVSNELKLAIRLPKQEVIKWQIIDATGRLISNQTKQVTAGATSFTIDVSRMTKGIYFINIESKAGNKQLRFVRQ